MKPIHTIQVLQLPTLACNTVVGCKSTHNSHRLMFLHKTAPGKIVLTSTVLKYQDRSICLG